MCGGPATARGPERSEGVKGETLEERRCEGPVGAQSRGRRGPFSNRTFWLSCANELWEVQGESWRLPGLVPQPPKLCARLPFLVP